MRFRRSHFAFQSPERADRRSAPIAGSSLSARMRFWEMRRITRFMRGTERTSPEPFRLRRLRAKWNTRNWRTEAGMNYPSDAPHPRRIWCTRRGRPVRRRSGRRLNLPRERPSLHDRSERTWVASRNQTNWFAAIAGAMTWLRVSSSGGIADAASVLVNAMDQRHGRGR